MKPRIRFMSDGSLKCAVPKGYPARGAQFIFAAWDEADENNR